MPDIVDCIVDITETGRALRAAGLRIIDTILLSYTELIANPAAYADPDKRHAMAPDPHPARGRPRGPGQGAGEAQRAAAQLDAVIELLPSMKAPTVNELYAGRATRSRRWCPRRRSTC